MGRPSPSTAVVEQVAQAEGTSPKELEPPLFEAVDPEALDRLFASSPSEAERSAVRVTFEYLTYEVTVTDDRRVAIREKG